jgi:hypothetical protein
MVSVISAVFPSSTVPKFRLPPSAFPLEAAEVEVGVEAGVGADGLALSQAEAARDTRSTIRESERTSGHFGIERRAREQHAAGIGLRAATGGRITAITGGAPCSSDARGFRVGSFLAQREISRVRRRGRGIR